MKNETDYEFPVWWGRMMRLANDSNSEVTLDDAYEKRNKWFNDIRTTRQVKRQYENGAHKGFERGVNLDQESSQGRSNVKTVAEALVELNELVYTIGDSTNENNR